MCYNMSLYSQTMLNAKLTQSLLLPYLPLPASPYLLSLENSITAGKQTPSGSRFPVNCSILPRLSFGCLKVNLKSCTQTNTTAGIWFLYLFSERDEIAQLPVSSAPAALWIKSIAAAEQSEVRLFDMNCASHVKVNGLFTSFPYMCMDSCCRQVWGKCIKQKSSDCVQSCDAAGSYGVHSQFIVVNFLFWTLVTGYTASITNSESHLLVLHLYSVVNKYYFVTFKGHRYYINYKDFNFSF